MAFKIRPVHNCNRVFEILIVKWAGFLFKFVI